MLVENVGLGDRSELMEYLCVVSRQGRVYEGGGDRVLGLGGRAGHKTGNVVVVDRAAMVVECGS